MKKKQKKELLLLSALIAFVPLIFLIVGFINLFSAHNNSQATGFFISAAVAVILGAVLLAIQYRSFRRQNQASRNSHPIAAQIDNISILDGVLRIDAHYIRNNQKYNFGAVYSTTTEDTDKKITEKFQNGEMRRITINYPAASCQRRTPFVRCSSLELALKVDGVFFVCPAS